MKEFMLIYKDGDKDTMDTLSPEQMTAVMQKWTAWLGKLQQSEQLVSGGSPLIPQGKNLHKDGVVTDISASEMKELVSGYSIISAESIETAIDIAKDCPIFDYPGKSVQVREVMQIG